jgi:peptidoglycan LD-endopeptidase LytH
MIDFKKYKFHPVIHLPKDYEVYDFTKGYEPNRKRSSEYGIGKYNEKRVGMYKGELYSDHRDIHMGIDMAAPIGTGIHGFYDGEVFLFGNNDRPLDYGYTFITKHVFDGQELYALWGHLSKKSLDGKRIGDLFRTGDVIAWVGDKTENGGWNPHLHFQLCIEVPTVCDMPGVVHEKDLKKALTLYPDPQLVLGRLY